MRVHAAVSAAFLLCLFANGAFAAETVNIAGSNAVLLRPASPAASIILMPGGDGHIGAGPGGEITQLRGNQLVRTRDAYRARGFAVLVVDANVDLARAVDHMAAIKRPVIVVATSRGTLRAAHGIARGAKPDALVLTAGFLTDASGGSENVASILGSPQRLPRTLVIHHRQDGCRHTRPAGVEPFVKWAAGKASVRWLDGGANTGNPCQARAYHGFNGLDSQVVALAADFR